MSLDIAPPPDRTGVVEPPMGGGPGERVARRPAWLSQHVGTALLGGVGGYALGHWLGNLIASGYVRVGTAAENDVAIVLGLVLAGRADLNRHAACVQVRAAYASSNAWGGGGASDARFGASLAAIRTTDSSLQALISRAAAAQAKVVQSERNYDSTAQITQAEGEAWVPQNALLRACAP